MSERQLDAEQEEGEERVFFRAPPPRTDGAGHERVHQPPAAVWYEHVTAAPGYFASTSAWAVTDLAVENFDPDSMYDTSVQIVRGLMPIVVVSVSEIIGGYLGTALETVYPTGRTTKLGWWPTSVWIPPRQSLSFSLSIFHTPFDLRFRWKRARSVQRKIDEVEASWKKSRFDR